MARPSRVRIIALALASAVLGCGAVRAAGPTAAPTAPAPSEPHVVAFVTVWQLGPAAAAPPLREALDARGRASLEPKLIAPQSPPPDRPEAVEALLPGSAPSLSRHAVLLVPKDDSARVDFEESPDGIGVTRSDRRTRKTIGIEHVSVTVNVDGRGLPQIVLPSCATPCQSLWLAHARDGRAYAVGVSLVDWTPPGAS